MTTPKSKKSTYTPNANGALQDKLRALLGKTNAVKVAIVNNRNATGYSGADGEDHLNIGTTGLTALGKLLAPNSNYPFNVNRIGKFNSLTAVHAYVIAAEHPEVYHTLDDRAIREDMRDRETMVIRNIQAILLDAMYQKVCQVNVLRDALRDNDLPYTMYYVNKQNGHIHTDRLASIMIPVMNELTSAIKADRRPDVKSFIVTDEKDAYCELKDLFARKVAHRVSVNKTLETTRIEMDDMVTVDASPEVIVTTVTITDHPYVIDGSVAVSEPEHNALVDTTHHMNTLTAFGTTPYTEAT